VTTHSSKSPRCIARSVAVALTLLVVSASATGAAEAKAKNWTPPPHRIMAQVLADEIMSKHPELISATFHGVPPGLSKVYTMFAGSYPERIGNPDDPDDVMIIETGITILDPRWHRTHDAQRKFVVMIPLRDAKAENIGLLVLAYKNPSSSGVSDLDYLAKGTALRDELQLRIPSMGFLFTEAP